MYKNLSKPFKCNLNVKLLIFNNLRNYFYHWNKLKRFLHKSSKKNIFHILNIYNKYELLQKLEKTSKNIENKKEIFETNKNYVKSKYTLNDLNKFVFVNENNKSKEEKINKSESKNNKYPILNDDEIKLEKLLKKRNIKKSIITITEEAKKEIKKIIENNNKENKNNNHVLKLYFITKGCNGLTHSFNFVDKNAINKDDEIIYDDHKTILLVIDNKCVLYVINTILDYYKDDLTEKFIFKNPNITSICPCGTSFHFSKKQ
ncbi:iron-sulfur assembly protein, putative [Plasmodium gallinaceum]|uniref:Iron-sulfur assembly protein, putative n=1 Tax=Plasmodium gallinaceum TaxID=5849 RepID=A0A1J1GP39_PLAGA|nr:iron-sulfur assembly protein, putative [Plasmodium gallinaceum]CRG94234.1 iron-sulfur assembly protein, putative [Plasmodium gallinaceum]